MPNPGIPTPTRRRTPPLEPGSIAYPQATWTSFDRYDRYVEIARLVRSSLGPGRHRVLDVGDTAGYLALLEPELWVVGIDLALEAERLDGSRPMLGDGSRLPFADDAFDAVVSSDVLEHVLPERRDAFLAELRRVSRELVVVAAPFATPGVAGAEDLVRRYAALALGAPQPQLEEHRERGLPDLGSSLAGLLAAGGEGAVIGNGNLWDWLVAMLLRFQLEARPALGPLSQGFDAFHNTALASAPSAPPFYRHLLVSWIDRAPELVDEAVIDAGGTGDDEGSAASAVAGAPVDLVALASVLVSADTSEVVRQDVNAMLAEQVVGPLATIDAGLNAMHERVGGFTELLIQVAGTVDQLSVKLDQLQTDLTDTRTRLEELYSYQTEVNAPVLRVKSRLQRVLAKLRR